MPRGTRKNSKKQAEKNGSLDLPLLQLAQAGDACGWLRLRIC
ncbi:MAG: hypothetical protein V7K46_24690 [Nostoc sp.]